jgi:glycosyltransferase involved in cell wall biosynthesis
MLYPPLISKDRRTFKQFCTMDKTRLAIITTHPIQYYAPVFRALTRSDRVHPRVFFTWSQSAAGPIFDPGFGTSYEWDVPLLDGYESEFVPNVAANPGLTHFDGVVTPELTERIASWRADAVLVFGWNLRSHLAALRYFKSRLPVFFRGDSTLLDASSSARAVARRLFLTWIYRHVDVAISVGQNNRDYFHWCGLPQSRIKFAPHSIDNDRFADPSHRESQRADGLRKEMGIREDEILYLYAGKLIDKKDPILLLDAFSSMSRPAHLAFFGGGELEAELRRRARDKPNIHFRPFQNQSAMPGVYRLGDVFVLPSKGPGETWGLAINEAMASARAVIAGSRVGAARDLVMPGTNGWVFESGSAEALTRTLRESFDAGKNKLNVMGRAGLDAIQAWSPQATAAAIAEAVSSN